MKILKRLLLTAASLIALTGLAISANDTSQPNIPGSGTIAAGTGNDSPQRPDESDVSKGMKKPGEIMGSYSSSTKGMPGSTSDY